MKEDFSDRRHPLVEINPRFMNMDSWRVMKMMAEIVESFDAMKGIDRMLVSVFGSARTKPESPYYKSAEQIGKLLAGAGYGIITGGGPGIMEAAPKGAFENGGFTVGLNIKLPHEQNANAYQSISLFFNYFFIRKVTFLKYSCCCIVYPGGFGTMDELSEVLTMVQTGKINMIPIILVGRKFWTFMQGMLDTMLEDGTISPEDVKLIKIVDTAEEAVDFLVECHRYGKRGTVIN